MNRVYLRAVNYSANGLPLPNSHTEYEIADNDAATHHADFGDAEIVPTTCGGPPTMRVLLASSAWSRVAAGR